MVGIPALDRPFAIKSACFFFARVLPYLNRNTLDAYTVQFLQQCVLYRGSHQRLFPSGEKS